MAVEDKYINANIVAGKLAKAIHSNGGQIFAMEESFEIAAADDDASVFRIFKNIPADLIPLKLEVMCDGITGGTDIDLGLYETDTGAVVDKDCLADGLTIAVAKTRVDALDGLSVIDIADANKMIYELGGHTTSTRKAGYDLCMTANTIGSAAGTVTIIGWFAQG